MGWRTSYCFVKSFVDSLLGGVCVWRSEIKVTVNRCKPVSSYLCRAFTF